MRVLQRYFVLVFAVVFVTGQAFAETNFPPDGTYVDKDKALALSDKALIFLYDKDLPESHRFLYQSIADTMRTVLNLEAYAYASNVELGRMQIAANKKFVSPVFSSDKLNASVKGRAFLLQYGPKVYREQFGGK